MLCTVRRLKKDLHLSEGIVSAVHEQALWCRADTNRRGSEVLLCCSLDDLRAGMVPDVDVEAWETLGEQTSAGISLAASCQCVHLLDREGLGPAGQRGALLMRYDRQDSKTSTHQGWRSISETAQSRGFRSHQRLPEMKASRSARRQAEAPGPIRTTLGNSGRVRAQRQSVLAETPSIAAAALGRSSCC